MSMLANWGRSARLIAVKVEGHVAKKSHFDVIFPVEELLSVLRKCIAIPAGTTILSGTPASVGEGQNLQCELKHGDKFEVGGYTLRVLTNTVTFQE